MLELKVGDVVRLIPQKVNGVDIFGIEGRRMFRLEGKGNWWDFDQAEEIVSSPIPIGDRVMHIVAGVGGVLIGIDGEDAWVRTGKDHAIAVKVKNLTRCG